METTVFSPTAQSFPLSTQTFLIIVVVLGFLVILALILLCLCRQQKPEVDTAMALSEPGSPQSMIKSTEHLIPPLFYTEGLRDPLQQEDLRDRVQGVRIQPSRV
jgi:hypothetical protein